MCGKIGFGIHSLVEMNWVCGTLKWHLVALSNRQWGAFTIRPLHCNLLIILSRWDGTDLEKKHKINKGRNYIYLAEASKKSLE